jgi:hypothetical protein
LDFGFNFDRDEEEKGERGVFMQVKKEARAVQRPAPVSIHNGYREI